VNSPDWTFFLVALVLDWLLTAIRASLVHVRLPRLMDMRERNPQSVERTLKLLESARLRIGLRVSMVLLHFLLAVAAWQVFLDLSAALASIILPLVFLMVMAILALVVEFAIEGLVRHSPETWAVRLTTLGQLADFVLWPLSSLMLLVLGPQSPSQHQMSNVTEDDLKSWAEEDHEEGGLEQGERQMIYSIFQFGDTLCREIMVPRIDVFALEVSASLPEAIETATASGHSRVPVYAETIDNIVGILYAKDLLRVKPDPTQNADSQPIRGLCRPAFFVPEAKKVDELLREMQARRFHMAIVVDEYGGMAGIVTLEDIVEEIVGEIQDEYDVAEEKLYQQNGPEEYSFQGRINLDDFNEVLGTHLAKDNADTLGGYIYGEIGKVPTGGEQLTVDDWTLTVEQVTGRRIRRVLARRVPPPVVEGQEKKDDVER
jgi:CBS domain containing-hemolysin-like protein